MDNRTFAEPRACGSVSGSNGSDCKAIASQEATNAWTYVGDQETAKAPTNAEVLGGRSALGRLTSSRTGENSPYGMIRGGEGNVSH